MALTTETGSEEDRTTELQTSDRTGEQLQTRTPGLRTQTETPGGTRATVKVLAGMTVSWEVEIVNSLA